MKLSPGLRVSSPLRRSEDRGLLRRLPSCDPLLASPKMVSDGPGPPLPHLPLLIWRIFGGLEDASCLICDSWRPSSAARYETTWRSFRDFLSARGILLSVDLMIVLDYSLLIEAWRTE